MTGQIAEVLECTAAQSLFEWLISPVGKETYFNTYWEKQPLVIRRKQPDYYHSLLTFDDIDRVITTLDRRYPDICLKDANRPDLSAADYALPGGALDVVKLYELFHQGSTITLTFLDTIIPALTLFCRDLEKEFNCPFQTNVYMTPPGAQGAKPHYDTHDVFVLQAAGSKKWTIFGTPVESPLQGQSFDEGVHEIGAPTLQFELEAGDFAYIPRGVAHEARSTNTVSLHVTTGVLRYTWADLLLECIGSASLENAAFRKALPPGFARSGFERDAIRDKVRDLLLRAAAMTSNVDAALDSLVDRFLMKCPPVLDGQLQQLAMLDQLGLDTAVGARSGVVWRIQTNGSSVSIESYNRNIRLPAHADEAVRFALNSNRFAVKQLPGNLDDTGKLTLVRRLIREGFLIAFRD